MKIDSEALPEKLEHFISDNLLLAINETISVDGDVVSVGMYKIIPASGGYAVMVGRKRLDWFAKKSWAVAMGLLLSIGLYTRANKLNALGTEYNRLKSEWDRFERLKRQNPVLYENRQSRVHQLIEETSDRIFNLIDDNQIW